MILQYIEVNITEMSVNYKRGHYLKDNLMRFNKTVCSKKGHDNIVKEVQRVISDYNRDNAIDNISISYDDSQLAFIDNDYAVNGLISFKPIIGWALQDDFKEFGGSL